MNLFATSISVQECVYVKNLETVLSFKVKLEGSKKYKIYKSIVNNCYLWNVSNEVLGLKKGLGEPIMLIIS